MPADAPPHAATVPERPGPARRGAWTLHALAVGFYATSWAAAALLAYGAAQFLGPWRAGLGRVPGWAVAAWCALNALFLVLGLFGRPKRRAAGRALRREEAPALFDLIDATAARVGVGAVSELRLKPAPVMAAARVLRPGRFVVSERRALVVGVPLLRALSVDEFRAAVAHELAHLAAGDVQRGRIVGAAARRIAVMRTVLARPPLPAALFLRWANPVWWYVRAYGALLARGAARIRRVQESHADALAAEAAGATCYAATLLEVAATELAFRRLAPGIVVRSVERGAAPANFFADLAAAHAALGPDARRRLAREVLDVHDEDATGHPPLRLRLAALGVHPAVREAPPTRAAAELVPALERIEGELTPLALRGLALGMADEIRRRRARRDTAAAAAAAEAR